MGGAAILSLAWVHTFWPFFLLMLLHCLLYVPTISISKPWQMPPVSLTASKLLMLP